MIVAICDKDIDSINQLEAIINILNKNVLIYKFNSIQAFVDEIENGSKIDIVFMTIEWDEEKTGIDYLNDIFFLNPEMRIIYATSHSDRYSEKIFLKKVNLCGLLIKPFKIDYVDVMLNNAIESIGINNRAHMIIHKNRNILAILYKDILYLESKAHHVIVHTLKENITFYGNLEDERKKLPYYFIKSHKSYTVNVNHIKKIDSRIHLSNGESIDISRSCAADVRKSYTEIMKK